MAPPGTGYPVKEEHDTGARALSFLVQDAGNKSVNGVYIRCGQQNQGVDVFVKKGTNYALFRRKENHWSLADLGGGSPSRWNLRCVEFYRCDRVPGGFVPPDFGWKATEGLQPCPFVVPAKNPSLRLALPRMELVPQSLQLAVPNKLTKSQSTGAIDQVFGNSRLNTLAKERTAPIGSAAPLFASSHAALTAGLSRQGTAGHVNFILAYSVVLSRPNSRVAWGYTWRHESYEDIGARDIESIDDGSPLARWNTWQSVRSRPDFCVLPGDRLLKVDGRWAHFDQEIGYDEHEIDDPSQSLQRKLNAPGISMQSAFAGGKAGKASNNIVFDFARCEVLRPMPPGPPKVTQPESEAMMEISWSSLAWHPMQTAWAVIIQDTTMHMWYTIDAAGTARPRADGIDVGAIRGDTNFVTVLKGLTQGRTYAACVAVCTEYGWSALSALSRAITLTTQFAISDVLLEDFEHPAHAVDPDAWPDRPHFVVPARVVPGATAPVSLLPGPNSFMNSRRRLHMQVVCPTIEGLELQPVDFVVEVSRDSTEEMLGLAHEHISRMGICLVVTGISRGGLIDEWNSVNAPEVQVRKGDRIMAVNAVRKDMNRMQGTMQEALIIRLTIVRGPLMPKTAEIQCPKCHYLFKDNEPYCTECKARRPKDPRRAQEDEDRQVLQVVNIRQGTLAAKWIKDMESEPASFHGAAVGRGVRIGDKVIRMNGVTGAEKMVAEVQRKPSSFAMTVERVLGHDLEGTDAAIVMMREELKAVRETLKERGVVPKRLDQQPEMQEKRDQIRELKMQRMREAGEEWMYGLNDEEVFEVDTTLDFESVKLAEEVQFNCLLPPDEGELALAIVGSEMEHLEVTLEAVLRLSQEATIAAGNRPPRYTYPSLVADAESRVLLFDRRAKTDTDRIRSREPGSPASQRASFNGEAPEIEDMALTTLKSAIVDVRCDAGDLRGAINLFDRASPAVKSSPAAKSMLLRAETLYLLWSWQARYISAKQRLYEVVCQSLDYERLRMDNDSDSEEEEWSKPYDVLHVTEAIDEAQEYTNEMKWELVEAAQIRDRQATLNTQQAAKENLHAVLGDPREDKETLIQAIQTCKEANVSSTIINSGNEVLQYLERKHKRDRARDAIRKALKGLAESLKKRGKPGAGAPEQKIVRDKLEEAHLDEDDPLAIEADDLLAQWKTANSVLRAEAKLHSAVKRASGGWKHSEQRAGELLGSAIAQVATEGVDFEHLEEARETLTQWEISRKKKAASELEISMQYGDTEALREAIEFAVVAGFTEEEVRPHRARLERLRYEDQLNKMLTDAMDDPQLTDLMEKSVKYAHGKKFVESESTLLCSATLQLKCRFWTDEFREAIKTRTAAGLGEDVDFVQELVERCEAALAGGLEEEPEIATRCLERDVRALKLLFPTVMDMAAVHIAEAELNRVLGAVERNAEDLPEVIRRGSAAIGAGLNKELLHRAIDAKKAYDSNVGALEKAIDHPNEPENLKNFLIKAYLCGAPEPMLKRAWKILEEQFPDIEKYARIELEVFVALAEADDIDEMSVESRFLRLQGAADEARKLNPELIPETWKRVDETSLALAAERTLVMQIADAEVVLNGVQADGAGESKPGTAASGVYASTEHSLMSDGSDQQSKPRKKAARGSVQDSGAGRGVLATRRTSQMPPDMALSGLGLEGLGLDETKASTSVGTSHPTAKKSAEEVEKMAAGLKNAVISAEQSALDEAKTLIPVAEELMERLVLEAKQRRQARHEVEIQKDKRQGSSESLRVALINAREASVAAHIPIMRDGYEQLRSMKVAFLSEDMNAALMAGQRPRAIACWFRAQALGFQGIQTQDTTVKDFFVGHDTSISDILTVQGQMMGQRCGGSFGTATWRENPLFHIRYSSEESGRRNSNGHHHSMSMPHAPPLVNVTVAIAEGSDMPANLAVHVVRNSPEAAAAGCKMLLAPGYEIIASSHISDDIPTATFELIPSNDNRPVFIVPSSAKSEHGPFHVIVEGSAPVDVIEVPEQSRTLWNYEVFQELEWAERMPFRKNMGGGRFRNSAPALSWYQNPQFRVRLKSRSQVESELIPWSDGIVAKNPYSHDDVLDLAAQLSVTGVPVNVRIEILSATFAEIESIEGMNIFWTCEVKGKGTELFRTKAMIGSLSMTFNHTYTCDDFHNDESFVFSCFKADSGGQEECMGLVTMPFSMFNKGYNGSVGMVMVDAEEEASRQAGGTVRAGAAQLHLKIRPVGSNEELAIMPSGTPAGSRQGSRLPSKESIRASRVCTALLQARLLPSDHHQKVECAIHIVKNLPSDDTFPAHVGKNMKKKNEEPDAKKEESCITDNPYYHDVIASSGEKNKDYIEASEVGCVCKLLHGATAEDDGECVYVIPSLELKSLSGKFKLELQSTEDIIVERVH